MRHALLAVAATALLALSMIGPARSADKSAPPTVAVADLMPKTSQGSCYAAGLGGASVNTVRAEGYLPAALSASGWTLAGRLGCDLRIASIVIGALAQYEVPVDTDGSFVKADAAWMVAGRAGYMVNPYLLAYGLIGYTQADLKVDALSLDSKGLVAGAGLEVMANKALSLTMEYTRDNLGALHEGPVELKPTNHTFRVGAVWRFTPLFGD